ncbi:porin family protein [Ferrimonas marina]|uniref:Outer membrane protein beta-barrel domain-containing protein n=1 Tax=Ferrimonas marina TaxID=299255 RepID=A0A1M5XTJ9_9GAMM|nr:hypothetical protein [Ferrimonas marina]SHI03130.1 hypothetical protein SAMN02745129_3688 [Ferrimonas marina]
MVRAAIIACILLLPTAQAAEHRLLLAGSTGWTSDPQSELSQSSSVAGVQYHLRLHRHWSLVTGFLTGQDEQGDLHEMPMLLERRIGLQGDHSLYLQAGNQLFYLNGERGLGLTAGGGWQWHGQQGWLMRLGFQQSSRAEQSANRIQLALGWRF